VFWTSLAADGDDGSNLQPAVRFRQHN